MGVGTRNAMGFDAGVLGGNPIAELGLERVATCGRPTLTPAAVAGPVRVPYVMERNIGRHEVLQPHRGEQRLVVGVGSSHRCRAPRRSSLRGSSPWRRASIGISTAC
jgi:hypothetical protein